MFQQHPAKSQQPSDGENHIKQKAFRFPSFNIHEGLEISRLFFYEGRLPSALNKYSSQQASSNSSSIS